MVIRIHAVFVNARAGCPENGIPFFAMYIADVSISALSMAVNYVYCKYLHFR